MGDTAGFRQRLRECVYISPSGSEFALQFDDVTRQMGKKAPVTEFPLQSIPAIQDLGQAAVRFPLSVYLTGPDYDVDADKFWSALRESGPGELRHPRYGDLTVVPVSVSQSEGFVRGSARAVFEIEFVQTDPARFEYPDRIGFSADAVSLAVDDAALSIAASVADVDIDDPFTLAALKDSILGAVNAVSGTIATATGAVDDLRNAIDNQIREITNTIDDLVQAPANLMGALLTLYRLPARVISTVQGKIDGYIQLYTALVQGFVDTTQLYGEMFGLINAANASAIVAAAAEATADGDIETRGAGQSVAASLAGIQESLNGTLETIGTSYDRDAAVRRVTTIALQAIIARSINLPLEQSETLTQDEVLIPLVDRLYSDGIDIEEALDQFISYNRLQGSQLLILPAGKVVRWYE